MVLWMCQLQIVRIVLYLLATLNSVFPKTIHGAPARGAIVTVKTEEKTYIRSIDAGSGYLCQMEPVAHVGLGQVNSIQSVEVVWPGGERVLVENPSINQLLTISYPSPE